METDNTLRMKMLSACEWTSNHTAFHTSIHARTQSILANIYHLGRNVVDPWRLKPFMWIWWSWVLVSINNLQRKRAASLLSILEQAEQAYFGSWISNFIRLRCDDDVRIYFDCPSNSSYTKCSMNFQCFDSEINFTLASSIRSKCSNNYISPQTKQSRRVRSNFHFCFRTMPVKCHSDCWVWKTLYLWRLESNYFVENVSPIQPLFLFLPRIRRGSHSSV